MTSAMDNFAKNYSQRVAERTAEEPRPETGLDGEPYCFDDFTTEAFNTLADAIRDRDLKIAQLEARLDAYRAVNRQMSDILEGFQATLDKNA